MLYDHMRLHVHIRQINMSFNGFSICEERQDLINPGPRNPTDK